MIKLWNLLFARRRNEFDKWLESLENPTLAKWL